MNTQDLLLHPDNLRALRASSQLRAPGFAQLQALVPAPGAEPDWAGLLDAIPDLRMLARTPQDARYHAEGDVWTHTRLVVEALLEHADYRLRDEARRFVLFYAALLHDIAKPATTRVDEISGAIGQPGHSARGAIDVRIMFWHSGVPFDLREAVCRLIAVHQLPFYAIRGNRNGLTAEYLVRKLSHEVNIAELALLAEADMHGRICADAKSILLDIELFRELAREEGCYEQPRVFADIWTRQRYFGGSVLHPDYAYHHEPGARVTVMSGLPASGKDSWVAKHRAGLPVVSFDDARAELGLRHGENEGQAAHYATDKAKELLRRCQDFVWNATHLSRQMRAKTLDLLLAYGATVEVVYLEQPPATLFTRNTRRDSSLRNADIEKMLYRWEVVLPTEAHGVRYLTP